jgi:ornithine carbamoyltransferase
MDFRAAAPKMYQPTLDLQNQCFEIAQQTRATITISENVKDAVKDCDFLYTDLWLYRGEPAGV